MATTENTAKAQSAQQRIASVIRMLMAGRGEQQSDLAAALHMDSAAVSRMLKGARKMSVNELEAIAAHYGQPVSVFFAGPDELLRIESFATPLEVIDGEAAADATPPRRGHLQLVP